MWVRPHLRTAFATKRGSWSRWGGKHLESHHKLGISLKKTHKRNLEQFILCMEYTGIYNSILLRVLQQKGLRVCMEGASNIKLSLGMQRENDKVDAQRIAEYSLRFTDRLKEWSPRREVVEKLGHLMSSRARLVNARKHFVCPITRPNYFLTKGYPENYITM